jgi:hypothetical protein
MAHITLSIPDTLYKEMKKHVDVKWSAAARKGILQKLHEVQGVTRGSDWLQTLPESTRQGIKEVSNLPGWKQWQKDMRKKEAKRAKSSTRAS